METAALKSFATWARTSLIREVSARITAVLAPGSTERVEQSGAVAALERAIQAAGGGDKGRASVADTVAYTWFNRIVALRFMDANGYTGIGVVSPQAGLDLGQPEILAEAKRGVFDTEVTSQGTRTTVTSLLDGSLSSVDPQGEAYALLLADYCRHWNKAMPFMFEREGDFTELLIPSNLLSDDSVLNRAVKVLTEDVCQDVEVIGWLYQFYISERKDEVFAGFKKGRKAGAEEIPAATQLFTPDWIVRYLVQNSLGRLWMLNRPSSRLIDRMDYYVAPIDVETDFLEIVKPEDLTVIDPACGSGHMLTYAFDLLYAIYEEEGYAPSDIPTHILANNLHGTEIDPRAGALAAFALTMKARAKQRTLFNAAVRPSICVIDQVSFDQDELHFLCTTSSSDADARFWNQFSEASTLGALVRPESSVVPRLSEHLAELEAAPDLTTVDVLLRARKVIEQSQYLSQRYSVAIANPPYMGSRNMAPSFSSLAGELYPMTRTDLFSMFIERILALTTPNGAFGIMCPNTWMYINAHAGLRKLILTQSSILSLMELPLGGFKDATVQICAFTGSRTSMDTSGVFLRLTNLAGDEVTLVSATRTAVADSDSEFRYLAKSTDFLSIEGSPLAYWLPDSVRRALTQGASIGNIVEFPTSPHKTGDNASYLRRWWEVSHSAVGVHARWVPYAKGGGARRWFGLVTEVVDWSEPALRFYSSNPTSALMKRDANAPEGVTYSMLTSGTNTFRLLDPGYAFDMGGPGFFSKCLSVEQVLAIVNSDMARLVLQALNPTLNLQVRDVKQIPVPDFDADQSARLHDMASKAIRIARQDWDQQETSLDFAAPLLLRTGSQHLETAVDLELQHGEGLVSELTRLERDIDSMVWTAAQVDAAHFGAEGRRALIQSNYVAEYGAGRALAEYRNLATRDLVLSLVSYAVGCMFGRYSLDAPGLILADQGATVQDYLMKVPSPTFMPDTDNVIPIVDGDWFEDDIVERFRQFLRAAFGEEHFAENLRFVTETLGVKNLRDYFVKSFYKDHIQRYKKRPIYWLFSSPNGSFNALIYMHRYTPSTVSIVLNEYVREFQAKLKASLEHAEVSNNAKEAGRLRKVLLELDGYEHDELYPLASQNVVIDLDDGVKVNYPKFGAALKKIVGLEANE